MSTVKKSIETLTHEEASRKNIPTAEYHSVMQKDEQSPIRVAYERQNRDLDPQPDIFADFNGLPDKSAKTEFYQHDANW